MYIPEKRTIRGVITGLASGWGSKYFELQYIIIFIKAQIKLNVYDPKISLCDMFLCVVSVGTILKHECLVSQLDWGPLPHNSQTLYQTLLSEAFGKKRLEKGLAVRD